MDKIIPFLLFLHVFRDGAENEKIQSVGIDEEPREGAIFIGVPPMNFATVQLNAHLVPYVQV